MGSLKFNIDLWRVSGRLIGELNVEGPSVSDGLIEVQY